MLRVYSAHEVSSLQEADVQSTSGIEMRDDRESNTQQPCLCA